MSDYDYYRGDEEEEEVEAFSTYSLADLANLPDPDWLIKGFVPEGGYGVIYGPPGVGKTFVALDMAAHLACGMEWHGRRVKEDAKVLYFIGEGQLGIRLRLNAWLKHHPEASVEKLVSNLALVPKVPQANSRKDWLSFDKTVGDFDLVVVDTLARTMRGMDENSAKDVGIANEFMQSATRKHGCAGMFVHHSGKDGTTERGSVALRGDTDFMLKIRSAPAADLAPPNSFQLIVDKQKDAPDGLITTMQLLSVDMGVDQYGESVTSAVVNRSGDYQGSTSKGVRTPVAPSGFGMPF